MTLVVARKDPQTRKIYFVGETRLFNHFSHTTEDPFKNENGNGLFKMARIGNYLLAFAGNVSEIQKILSSVDLSFFEENDLIKYLSQEQKESEFLVSRISLNSNSELYVIKNGISSSVDSGWIGNGDAFSEFQRYQLEGQDNYNRSFSQKMKDSLEQVIHGRKFLDVGGIVVLASEGSSSFFFETGMTTSGFNLVFDENTHHWGIGMGSSAIGTTTIESCDFNEKGIIYYFYHQPRVLIVFKSNGLFLECVCNRSFSSVAEVELAISSYISEPFKIMWSSSR